MITIKTKKVDSLSHDQTGDPKLCVKYVDRCCQVDFKSPRDYNKSRGRAE